MRAELAGLNHCAVHFLSHDAANLCWYYYTYATTSYMILLLVLHLFNSLIKKTLRARLLRLTLLR